MDWSFEMALISPAWQAGPETDGRIRLPVPPEMPVTAESRDIGGRTQDNEMAEDGIKEPMKNVADDAHALPPNKPVIMDRRKTMEYSPSFQGSAQKLCNT